MLGNSIYVLEQRMQSEVADRVAEADRMRQAPPKLPALRSMPLRMIIVALVLTATLAMFLLSAGQANASAPGSSVRAAAYRADDYYVLVHDCYGRGCAAAADWSPYEQRLQQLFQAGGWGKDDAVVSRMHPQPQTFAAWAQEHIYYVEETAMGARRAAIEDLRRDVRGAGRLYIWSVPSKQR
jgi:hypothetical protein